MGKDSHMGIPPRDSEPSDSLASVVSLVTHGKTNDSTFPKFIPALVILFSYVNS